MIGMLQIITYLLCLYLVIKGIEVFQIALMSSRADRNAGIVIGVLVIIICIIGAVAFIAMIDSQAMRSATTRP